MFAASLSDVETAPTVELHCSGTRTVNKEIDMNLTPSHEKDFLSRGFSRRHFGKLASLIGAAGALPFYNESAMAQLSMVKGMPADAVKINANENPLGPCPEACEAIMKVVKG